MRSCNCHVITEEGCVMRSCDCHVITRGCVRRSCDCHVITTCSPDDICSTIDEVYTHAYSVARVAMEDNKQLNHHSNNDSSVLGRGRWGRGDE